MSWYVLCGCGCNGNHTLIDCFLFKISIELFLYDINLTELSLLSISIAGYLVSYIIELKSFTLSLLLWSCFRKKSLLIQTIIFYLEKYKIQTYQCILLVYQISSENQLWKGHRHLFGNGLRLPDTLSPLGCISNSSFLFCLQNPCNRKLKNQIKNCCNV